MKNLFIDKSPSGRGIQEFVLANKRSAAWVATALLFCGAMLISAVPGSAVWWQVFLVFLLGHIIYVIESVATRHTPMVALNLSFACMDIYAIVIRVHFFN